MSLRSAQRLGHMAALRPWSGATGRSGESARSAEWKACDLAPLQPTTNKQHEIAACRRRRGQRLFHPAMCAPQRCGSEPHILPPACYVLA